MNVQAKPIQAGIPAHVPPNLVYDFDYVTAPVGTHVPQQDLARRLAAEAPDIFFTPRHGGHWIVRRPADTVEMFRRPEDFSNDPRYNDMRQWKPALLPVQADPPLLNDYRKALGAYLAPGNMRQLETHIREIARAIVADIAPRGACDFVTEVGEIFPVTIFLQLVDAPFTDRLQLLKLAQGFTRSPSMAGRAAAIADLATYIRTLYDQRRIKPGSDMLSQFLKTRIGERSLTRDEEEGLGAFMLIAGLDTLRSAMSHSFLYLARHPEQYASLVANPAMIPDAVEELLRISGTSMPERAVTHDLEYRGIQMKHGERIIFLLPVMSFDPALNADPFEVNFRRELSQHLIFGAGPHRCAGSHLARIEIRVLLEEWIARIPSFALAEGEDAPMEASTVWTPKKVNLVWPKPA